MIYFTLLMGVAAMYSCNNDPEEIGVDIQPEDEMLEVFYSDTITLRAYSQLVDSVKTDEVSRILSGSYLDPVFGLTTANFATQVFLSTTSVDFGDSPQLDSVVLALEYTSIQLQGDEEIMAYGDTTTPQTYRVYELDEELDFDTSYYSNRIPVYKSQEIGIITQALSPQDSVMVDTTLERAQLRIPLSNEFGNSLLSQDTITSNDSFIEVMKGLYVAVDPVIAGGAIVFFDPLETYSRLILYYSNDEDDSLEYYFNISSACARYNTYLHDYDLADPLFLSQVQGDTSLGKSQLYVQSMGGVSTTLTLPYINDLMDKDIALNEASLIVTNKDQFSEFDAPANLALLRLDDDDNLYFLDDQYIDGDDYFGGEYDEDTGEYTFRITQYLQNVLNTDTLSRKLLLSVSGASYFPNRLVMNGYDTTLQDRMRLKLIYTKLSH